MLSSGDFSLLNGCSPAETCTATKAQKAATRGSVDFGHRERQERVSMKLPSNRSCGHRNLPASAGTGWLAANKGSSSSSADEGEESNNGELHFDWKVE